VNKELQNKLPESTDQPTEKPDKSSDQTLISGQPEPLPVEIGGPRGPEPTRFGDWERNGRCSDF